MNYQMEGAKKSNRLVFVRGGGLGDFLLTFPLLSEARNHYQKIVLFTKREYLAFNAEAFPTIEGYDLNSDYSRIFEFVSNSDVVSFWKDSEWENELIRNGANQVYTLEPRPSEPPHVAIQMFQSLGWVFMREKLQFPWLEDLWRADNRVLWIHPGSGSKSKNADFLFFEKKARIWLAKCIHNKIIFSFGEADESVKNQTLNMEIFNDPRVKKLDSKDLMSFKKKLISFAYRYMGNDSGPSHMAAMLGIPTEVYFRNTDPRIWKPMGPRVEVYDFESEASKIL